MAAIDSLLILLNPLARGNYKGMSTSTAKREAQFKAKGKRANAMRARTTPSFEETKSANMQNPSKTNKRQARIPCALSIAEHM